MHYFLNILTHKKYKEIMKNRSFFLIYTYLSFAGLAKKITKN